MKHHQTFECLPIVIGVCIFVYVEYDRMVYMGNYIYLWLLAHNKNNQFYYGIKFAVCHWAPVEFIDARCSRYIAVRYNTICITIRKAESLNLVPTMKPQKDTPCYWLFVRGIHRSPVNSTHKGQWRGALMFSLICVWINDRVNNGEAGDLRRYRIHYDVTVMIAQDIKSALYIVYGNLAGTGRWWRVAAIKNMSKYIFNITYRKKSWTKPCLYL